MDKQLATKIFMEIREEYGEIKNPKFHNIDLELWQEKYSELSKLKPFLANNELYKRLINGLSQAISKAKILEQARNNQKTRGLTLPNGALTKRCLL